MRFDELLKHIGEFGRYQRRVYLLVCIPTIFAAFHKLIWTVLGATPNFRCHLPEDDISNLTDSYFLPNVTLKNLLPWDEINNQWSHCEMYVNSTVHSNGSQLERQFCDKWVYDRSTYASTIVTEFNLVCDRLWMRPPVHSFYVFGEFLGCTVMSGLSDKIGRKKVLLITLIGQGFFGILTGCVSNYYAFIFLRTMVGMFTQGLILVGYVIALEFVGPSRRAIAGVATNYFFGTGYVLIAGSAYLFREWNHLQIFLSVPPLIYVVAVWWVPESARWLISVNKTQEALTIIEKAAAVNGKTLPSFSLEKDETIEKNFRVREFFLNPRVIFKILVMCFAWYVNSAVYYGLSLNISNLGGNDYLNFLIAGLLEFPSCTICILSIQYYGRRPPLCISMVLAGVALLAVIFVPSDLKILIIVLSMIGKFSITISYAIMYIFAAELYPTQVRNLAIGVNSTFARMGSMSTSFIIALADHWRPLPLIILGALSLSSGLLTLFLPETHRKALPESFSDASDLMKKADVANGNVVTKNKYCIKENEVPEAVELNAVKS